MAYTKYSLTPSSNTAAPPDGAPEGMLPSAVNDTMRDMMAQIRDCGDGIRDGTYTMTAPKITGGTITGSTINNSAIGGTTAAAGKFTTLEATGVATFSAGAVGTPAITTTGDTNTGIFFPAADTIAFTEGGVESMRIDSSGNVGIGTSSPGAKFGVGGGAGNAKIKLSNTTSGSGGADGFDLDFDGSNIYITNRENGFMAFENNGAERMRIDSSGNLLVNTTGTGSYTDGKIVAIASGTSPALTVKNLSSSQFVASFWNNGTTGDNIIQQFITEASPTVRGSITYNRTAGLTAYNTTSDYRAKDIISPVLNSGELIDSVPVYMGKMKGATQARPMFIAHETPDYAHTGEKDAVDKDGNPVYQQMDASSLVPVLWAEVQSLRKRVAQLESK